MFCKYHRIVSLKQIQIVRLVWIFTFNLYLNFMSTRLEATSLEDFLFVYRIQQVYIKQFNDTKNKFLYFYENSCHQEKYFRIRNYPIFMEEEVITTPENFSSFSTDTIPPICHRKPISIYKIQCMNFGAVVKKKTT